MSDTSSTSSGGVGLLGLLGVLFVGLKLTHFISWSWWWVTAPFWGAFALIGVILMFMLIGVLISAAVSTKGPTRRGRAY